MKIKKSKIEKLIKEAIYHLIDDNHHDHEIGRNLDYGTGEARMTRSQLYKVANYAQELHDMLNDEDDLPEWIQSKISVMDNDIGKIKHYLEYKILRDKH